jgi:hypothetical protein
MKNAMNLMLKTIKLPIMAISAAVLFFILLHQSYILEILLELVHEQYDIL